MADEENKRGAKPKVDYWLTDDGKTLLTGWARQGLSNAQLAKNMGVSESAFYDWKSKHKDISEAIQKGKDVVDFEVENALLRRAMGQEVIEYKEVETEDGTRTEKIVKNMPSDATSMIFWLKNRQPDRWNDRRQVEHSGGMTNTNVNMFAEITTEELKAIAKDKEEGEE